VRRLPLFFERRADVRCAGSNQVPCPCLSVDDGHVHGQHLRLRTVVRLHLCCKLSRNTYARYCLPVCGSRSQNKRDDFRRVVRRPSTLPTASVDRRCGVTQLWRVWGLHFGPPCCVSRASRCEHHAGSRDRACRGAHPAPCEDWPMDFRGGGGGALSADPSVGPSSACAASTERFCHSHSSKPKSICTEGPCVSTAG